jgi:hypothetical protein
VVRFFLSRRLSILGVFATLSTWSWSILLQKYPFSILLTCFPILWIWGLLWAAKSSTYRAGLMFGLLCYMGTLLNYHFFALFPIGLMILILWQLRDETSWYKRQFLRYNSIGIICCVTIFVYHIDLHFSGHGWNLNGFYLFLINFLQRKSFFILSILGLGILAAIYTPQSRNKVTLHLDKNRLTHLLTAVVIILIVGLAFDKNLLRGFGLLWFVSFLSLLPLEWIFQSISRFRSKRNFIYVIYILICLLDSHFEGRVRRTAKFFQSTPIQVENTGP